MAQAQQAAAGSQEFVTRYFRVADRDEPRRGVIISPSDVGENGDNFRFCNGETARVDLKRLSPADPCDGAPPGTFTATAEELRGAPVYNPDFVFAGSVAGVGDLGANPLVTVDWIGAFAEDLGAQARIPAEHLQVLQGEDGTVSVVVIDPANELGGNAIPN